MKLSLQQVYDVTLLVSKIIREQRPMPLKGKYRLGRLHAKLLPEFKVVDEQRDAMIKAYDYTNEIGQQAVPDDKAAEFNAAWAKFAADEIEIDLQPVPFAQLDLGDSANGSIEAHELIVLGDLVAD